MDARGRLSPLSCGRNPKLVFFPFPGWLQPFRGTKIGCIVREGAIKCWNDIASNIPNRTNKDCRKRWNRIGKDIKKGPWGKEEDEALQKAVECFGFRWTLVAEAVGGRYADRKTLMRLC